MAYRLRYCAEQMGSVLLCEEGASVKKGDKGAGIWVNDSAAAITSITKE